MDEIETGPYIMEFKILSSGPEVKVAAGKKGTAAITFRHSDCDYEICTARLNSYKGVTR